MYEDQGGVDIDRVEKNREEYNKKRRCKNEYQLLKF